MFNQFLSAGATIQCTESLISYFDHENTKQNPLK